MESKKKKLIYKLFLFLLPFLFLSILITSVILSWTSYNYFLKTINQDYGNIIKSSAGEIRLYMKNARNGLKGLALMMTATKLDRWQKEMALTAFNHEAVEFMSVSLISVDGKEIITTGGKAGDITFSQSEIFRKSLMGQDTISGVMLTKEAKIPFIHIAIPLLRMGTVKEILWGELNLKSVWDVLDGINVGHTGHVFIMDRRGRLIGHREIDRVVKGLPAEKSSILKKLRETDTPVQWVQEKDKTRFYCLGYNIPDLDWVIVLRQAYPEIYAYLYKNIYWATLITFVICLAAIIISWNRVKRFLSPIQNLHAQVQRIGRGHLDQKVSIDSQDEIGDLGLAFNEMTDSLKRYIGRLSEEHRQRKQLSKELIDLLEKDRRRVAMELHDQVGQTLIAIKMELERVQTQLNPPNTSFHPLLTSAKDRTVQTIRDIKDISYALSPDMLYASGLISSLRELFDDFKKRMDLKIHFFTQDVPKRFDQEKELAIYRIVQEAMNNIIKHAHAKVVYVNLIKKDAVLSLSVEDDGVGFESNRPVTSRSEKGPMGLRIMEERVVQLGGEFSLESQIGKGTHLLVEIAL